MNVVSLSLAALVLLSGIDAGPQLPELSIERQKLPDGTLRLSTVGLAARGYADFQVSGVAPSLEAAGRALVLAVRARLLEGARLDAQGQLSLVLAELGDPALREEQLSACFPGAKQVLLVRFDRATLRFPTLKCGTDSECFDAASSQLYGSFDPVKPAHHDARLKEASRRARTKFFSYQSSFSKGLPEGEVLLVKAPFPCEAGGREYMWVEVVSWSKGEVRGLLNSDPKCRMNLMAGARVAVKEDDVFDFVHQLGDDTFYGNETGKVFAPQLFEEVGGGRARVKSQ